MPDMPSQVERSVILITYGRSGSTMLQNMLNALPGHLIRGENELILADLVRAWHTRRVSSHPGRLRARGMPSGPQQPWFGYERIDVDAFGRALAATFVQHVLRPRPDTRVIGFKEIRWHQEPELFGPMLEFMTLYFPDARFVFNARDHAAVARSGWWKRMPEAEVRARLERADALYAEGRAAHADRSIALRYEDLTRGPEAWREVMAFLDVPFDETLVRSVLERRLTHPG